jgi:hydroxymethylbilane synthase
MTTLRVGTRGSRMALAQTGMVADLLRAAWPGLAIEIIEVQTAGDRDQETPLQEGRGWFTSALQDSLLAGTIDIAVHSYKDLPTARPPGLSIAAVPLRGDPRDALISRGGRTLKGLAPGSVVGTSSPRREAQVLAIRPDLEVRPIRGNVDTRISKVEAGEFDAIVVAMAGLARLGAEARVTEVFGLYDMIPAPAQGALAVECRSADTRVREIVAGIDDPSLRQLVTAERSFLATLEAGCSFPAAAYAEHFGSTLKLHALVAPGGRIFRSKMAGSAETAAGLGRQLAQELMALADMR